MQRLSSSGLGLTAACPVRPKLRLLLPSRARALQTVKAFYNKNNVDVGDRLIAGLPYLIPLLDAIPTGKFVFMQYPFIARALAPIAPLAMIYNGIPFAPFLIFLGVYAGIVNNQSFSRFVRYNAAQAVVLDILLIIPQVILGNVFKMPDDGILLQMYISSFNTVFLFIAVCCAYGMGSCAVGQTPRLPLVASAADRQVGGGMDGPWS